MREQWILIDGYLPANHPCLRATAVFSGDGALCSGDGALCSGDGKQRLPLPVSLKGRLVEVVRAPDAEIRVEVVDGSGLPVAHEIQIQKISGLDARYRMLRRVLAMLPRLSTEQRRRLQLNWASILTDLYRAYRQVGSLRYHFPAPDYNEWFSHYWTLGGAARRRLERFMAGPEARALSVQVVIDARADGSPQRIQAAVRSVERQLGCKPRLRVLTDDAPWTLDDDQGLVVWMSTAASLEPWSLAWFVKAFLAAPSTQLLYSDHDHVSADGALSRPMFKPDWSPDLQLCSHYVGDVLAVRASGLKAAIARLGYVPDAYELVAEIGLGGGSIGHIPAVLWHEPDQPPAPRSTPEPERLSRILARHGIGATVELDARGNPRVRYDVPKPPPLVSIVIPTRDMLHFLKPCVESLLSKTTWPSFEVLIVDNQSARPETLAYLQEVSADPRVRVLRYDQPFNFSAINNVAVEQAQGEVVCLLNNDTEVISPDWLEEMVSRLEQPGVGVVGARLYFSDGRVQHAGDVVGPGGCAHHLFGVLEGDDPGYMKRAVLPQDLSAVTAACLVTPKKLFQKLGGLDAVNLKVAFNDVDYCLRVREAGLRVIYTPYAEFFHYESVSRGKDDNDEKRARSESEANYIRERWPEVIERDPFYNPNLNYARPDFTVGKVPRIDWPW